MKKLITLLSIISASLAYGQQDVQFTQFMQNRYFYNPGVTGGSGSICLVGVHRSQWVGIENAPVTQNLSAEMPLQILHGGIGIQFQQDKIGYFQDLTIGLSYAYQKELNNGGVLGIGLQLDFRNKSTVSGASWLAPDGSTGQNDPNIPNLGVSDMSIDPNFGIYYQDQNWWGGVSTMKTLEATAELENGSGSVASYAHKRSFIFMGGYNYNLSNSNITLMPALLVKSDLVSTTTDIHLGAMYNNKIWGGVTYRLQDALGIMAGYQINPDFKISYSYDMTLSNLKSASGGSHEILIGYCFKIEIPERVPGSIRDPRFL